jgi:hypothetical protein
MCSVTEMMRLGMPEGLAKRCCTLGKRLSGGGWAFVESAVERLEPLVAAGEESASAREKRAAALRAALDDVRWKPEQLKVALKQKSASTVSRYLSAQTPIPDRVYALPELGKAFHRREAHVFGYDEQVG